LKARWHKNGKLSNWNYAGAETFVSKFPDFKKWFQEIEKNFKWPQVEKFGIRQYKRFIFSRRQDSANSDNDTIEVWCYKDSLTRTESLSFWKNSKFSK
jgi:hypothetical protein